jgi:hypothetical protein
MVYKYLIEQDKSEIQLAFMHTKSSPTNLSPVMEEGSKVCNNQMTTIPSVLCSSSVHTFTLKYIHDNYGTVGSFLWSFSPTSSVEAHFSFNLNLLNDETTITSIIIIMVVSYKIIIFMIIVALFTSLFYVCGWFWEYFLSFLLQ